MSLQEMHPDAARMSTLMMSSPLSMGGSEAGSWMERAHNSARLYQAGHAPMNFEHLAPWTSQQSVGSCRSAAAEQAVNGHFVLGPGCI